MALSDLAVSTGSACASGSQAVSHVMEAIGATGDRGRASIRFGLGRGTTADDIEFAVDRVCAAVTALRVNRSRANPTSAVHLSADRFLTELRPEHGSDRAISRAACDGAQICGDPWVLPGRRSVRLRCAVSVLLFFGLSASSVGAQSIVDARRVEFLPSSDNSAVDSNGVALVDHYTMDIFPAGGAIAVETVDLGKPLPDADGYMRIDFVARLSAPLTPGVSYEAVVSAVGPGGSAASERSNTFGFSETCSFSLSPQSQSFSAGGGTGSFDVATGATCPWTAVSQASWWR